MSKQSKNARKKAAAKQVTANRKNGNKGPSRTTKLTSKRNTRFAILDKKVAGKADKRINNDTE